MTQRKYHYTARLYTRGRLTKAFWSEALQELAVLESTIQD